MFRRTLILLLVLSACAAPAPPPVQLPPSAPSPPASTTVPPKSETPTYEQLQAKADLAVLPVDGMTDYGVSAPDQDSISTSFKLTLRNGLCGQRVDIGPTPTTRYRRFDSDRALVHSSSWSFESTTGASVIGQLTKMAPTCTTWKDDVGFEHRLRTDFTIAKPDGVEAFFAYCDETEDTSTKYRYCAALAARGNLLIEVGTTGHITNRTMLGDLRAIVPRAVQRLLEASK